MLQKKLIKGYKRSKGRNNQGIITVLHKGGGKKKKYRVIDFKYKFSSALILSLEYDPNRNSQIFKLFSQSTNTYLYVLAVENLKINDNIEVNNNNNFKLGNIFNLKNIPLGSIISNIELHPGNGAKISRSSGTFCQLIKKTEKYAFIKMPSNNICKISLNCKAVLGKILEFKKSIKNKKKAGYSRWRGIRPTVRGVAMNPIDHPHGGGEGKTSGGRPSVNKKGIYTKGIKTRKNKKIFL